MGRHDAALLRYELLGPPRALLPDGREIDLGARQQQAVLVMLLLRGDRPVHRDELVRGVWEDPPRSAANLIQTYISRLRAVLDPGRDVRSQSGPLSSSSAGYLLRRETDQLDLARFERMTAQARRSRDLGDLAEAAAMMREALALWRSEPLSAVPGPFAETERNRLIEQRLTLLEECIDLELRIGGQPDLAAELSCLVAEHPLRERFRELLMLALYGSARQAEALAVFADTRRRLVDELGVEPGRRMQELHQRILASDVTLPVPRDPADRTAFATVPAQLPGDVMDFVGRQREIGRLCDLLLDDRAGEQALVVVVITGVGGLGKSSIAIRTGHRVASHFPDGQLFVGLEGASTRPAHPHDLLGRMLQDLGVSPGAVPDDPERRMTLYRSVIAGRRMLLIFDDARDARQIRPLLPGTPSCRVVVTSRGPLNDLAGATIVAPEMLDVVQARELFTRIAGRDRVLREPEATNRVVEACAGLPLALRIAAARLVGRPEWTIESFADSLLDSSRRLDELKVGDLAVRSTFQVSYDSLSEVGSNQTDPRRLFRFVGSLDVTTVDLAVVVRLTGQPDDEVEPALEALVDVHMLDSPAPGVYRQHDLLRLFARSLARDPDSGDDLVAAFNRVLEYLLATVRAAESHLWSGARIPGPDPAPDSAGRSFGSIEDALRWLDAERHHLVAMICQFAAEPGCSVLRLAHLVSRTRRYFELRGHWDDWELVARAALNAALRDGEAYAEAILRHELGFVSARRYRTSEATHHYRRSLELFNELGDALGRSRALSGFGTVHRQQGLYDQSIECFEQTYALEHASGDVMASTSTLNNLGLVAADKGDYAAAIRYCEECIRTRTENGRPDLTYVSLNTIGRSHLRLGDNQRAISYLERSIEMCADRGDRFWLANAQLILAEAYLNVGRTKDSVACCEEALAVHRDLADLLGIGRCLRQLSLSLAKSGDFARAAVCWEEATSVFERIGAPVTADGPPWPPVPSPQPEPAPSPLPARQV